MEELLEFAKDLGIRVVIRDLGRRKGEYRHGPGIVAISSRLSQVQARCTLAHELGHAWYCDDATAALTSDQEHRATLWAAHRLITAAAYAAAEGLVGPHAGAIARELGVTRDLIVAWQSAPVRFRAEGSAWPAASDTVEQ